MRVLVAEDDDTCAEILEHVLKTLGYQVTIASNGRKAFELLLKGDYRMVISDWHMPEMDGLTLCNRIRQRNYGAYVYVILLTCDGGSDNLIHGLQAGADDFITKPFRSEELQVRLRIGERVTSLEARDLIIFGLAKITESRDPETGAHLERMREYSRILAQELSNYSGYADLIDPDYVRTLYLTSPLHDIGKVAIPDSVLLKPGKLTESEFEIMKQHAIIGSQTLEAMLQVQPDAEFLRFARDIALSHHERFDGKGYPHQLRGDEIPLCGRIVALADVYDALTSKRIYKSAFTHEKAKSIILEEMEAGFDPGILAAFQACESDFVKVQEALNPEDILDLSLMSSLLGA